MIHIGATSDGKNITFNNKPGSYAFSGVDAGSTSRNSTSSIWSYSSGISARNVIPVSVTTESSNSKIVYYTSSGKSYHFDEKCRILSIAKLF